MCLGRSVTHASKSFGPATEGKLRPRRLPLLRAAFAVLRLQASQGGWTVQAQASGNRLRAGI